MAFLPDSVMALAVGITFIFAYLLENDKNAFVLKYVFLFAGIALIAFSFSTNYYLSSTTYTSVNGVTNYTYSPTPFGSGYATSLGILLIFMIVYFAWRIVKGLTESL